MSVVGLRAGITDGHRVTSVGVVANQDVEVPEEIVSLGDEVLAGRRVGEVSGKRDHRPGPAFAEILDQSIDVVDAAVLGEIVGEVVMHGE